MNYLLDTCVISELVRPKPDKNVIHWFQQTPSKRLFLSVITIGEIRKRIIKLPESQKKNQLADWLNTLLEDYQSRIYPVDIAVAETWGCLQGSAEKKGTPIQSVDSLIAAIALTHNLVIVTRNEYDFTTSNVTVINPWKNNGK